MSTGASVAKGPLAKGGTDWATSLAESGFLFRPLGILLELGASLYLPVHLYIDSFERGPTLTQPFLQIPWQSHWGMMEGGRGRKEGGQRLGRWVSSMFLVLWSPQVFWKS